MHRTTNLPNTRIEVADALRGIAVAGIILFHAREHFNLYWSGLNYLRAGFGGWEQTVAGALGFLLSGKMYAIFALLFGLSFFIQSDNQAQRGNDFSLRFAWRMVLLFIIGLVNAAIYNGDVLTYYAVFGLLMIPIGKLPSAAIRSRCAASKAWRPSIRPSPREPSPRAPARASSTGRSALSHGDWNTAAPRRRC